MRLDQESIISLNNFTLQKPDKSRRYGTVDPTQTMVVYIVRLFYYFGDLVGHAGQMQMTSKKAQYKYFPNPGFF